MSKARNTAGSKNRKSKLVVEMSPIAQPASTPAIVEEVAAVLASADVAPIVLASPAQVAAIVATAPAAKLPTKCPVGYWCRPNSKADSFGLGLYETNAKTQTGPIRATFPTRELLIAFAVQHKAGLVKFADEMPKVPVTVPA